MAKMNDAVVAKLEAVAAAVDNVASGLKKLGRAADALEAVLPGLEKDARQAIGQVLERLRSVCQADEWREVLDEASDAVTVALSDMAKAVVVVPVARVDSGLRLVAIAEEDADAMRFDAAQLESIRQLGAIDAWPVAEGGWTWEWARRPRTRAARVALLEAVEQL